MDPRPLVMGLSRLGSPPAIYADLISIINRPTARAADIAAVISDDPALTARLLRLVNSTLFGFPRLIESVETAVTVVGTSQLRDLALATSVISVFDGIPDEDLDMHRFWRHSLACGVGARVLASMRGELNVEAFFLAGLLHDVGRLVLLMEEPTRMVAAMKDAAERDIPLHVAERAAFGFDHAQVGQVLMERWRLGPLFEEVIAFHHDPILATRFPTRVASVHVADVIAGCAGWGSSGAPAPAPLSGEAWRRLDIEPSHIPVLLETIEEQWADVTGVVLENYRVGRAA